jgi:hypothetical protein
MNRMIMGIAAAIALGASVSAAQATSLDFIGGFSPTSSDANCIENGLPNCYGDHVSGSPNSNGSTIGQGNAFTPNIGAAYSGNLRVWTNGFGANAYLGSGNNVNTGFFTLTADPGFQIKLNSVTLDTDGIAGTHSVDLLAGGPGGTLLQSLTISGSDPVVHVLNLLGNQFTFAMGSWDFGVTNVNFDQVAAATPIPAAVLFFATGVGGLGFAGWRRRKNA